MARNGVRGVLLGAALFAVALAAYCGNAETITSYDSAPATVFTFNVLENRRLDYDAFRASYLDRIGGGYAFVEAPNGHLTSLFPVGTSLLTFPIFATLYALRSVQSGPPPILSPAFEDERHFDEKIAAATVAACAVVLCYFTARLFATPLQAGVVTFAFGFAGEMWTIGAQGLWEHGPVNLVLLGAIFAALHATRAHPGGSRAWLVVAGLCAGFLPTIRPTAALFTLAMIVFVLSRHALRGSWPWFALGLALGLAPGSAWNVTFFHSIAGGYSADLGAYDATPARVIEAAAGLLGSPSRGWLIFSPIVVFSIFGVLRAARGRTPPQRLVTLLGCASAVLFVNYSFYGGWIGGHCYGPRFLTDLSAVAALALVYVVPGSLSNLRASGWRTRAATAVFVLALLSSSVVQIVGSYSGAAGPVWNAIPFDIGRDPARIWSLHDNQIERNTRAMFYRYAPTFPTGGAGYDAAFAGTVTSVAGIAGARTGATPVVTARLRNDGTSRWYGYDTAVYNGEARVRATLMTLRGAVVSVQELYLPGTLNAGASAAGSGFLALPAVPGTYSLALEPFAFGRTDIPAGNIHALVTKLVVR